MLIVVVAIGLLAVCGLSTVFFMATLMMGMGRIGQKTPPPQQDATDKTDLPPPSPEP